MHLGEHFRGQAHHVGRFRGVLGSRRVVVEAFGHGYMPHVLNTTDHEHITVTGHDGLGSSMDSAHGRTTQTVYSLGSRLVRDTGQQRNLPSHVKALLFSLVYTAPDNIFYFFRVELRVALEQCVDQRSRQRLRTHVAETTVFGTTHRSPHAIDDDNVSRIKAHRSFSVRKSRSGLAKEFLASLGHFTQLLGRVVQRTKICKLVCQFNELVYTHIIDVAQGTTTERREADTEDQTHIRISRIFHDAIFQAANSFQTQRDHHAGDDVFVTEVVLTLNNRLKQLVGFFVDNLFLLALAVQFILVEANVVLLTVTVIVKHHVDRGGFRVLHAIREAVSHNVTGVLACVHANNVKQVGRAHRPAKLFHDLVDFLEVGAVTNQANETAKVREQNTVNQEARAIVHHDRSLAHGLGVSHGGRDGAITGLFTTDNLNQRHHMHRVEEVHTTEVFRTLQVLGQKVDGNRGGIGGDDGVVANHFFGFAQYGIFYLRVFNNRFNHQVYVLEIAVVQGWRDAVQNIGHLACIHTTFINTLGQKLLGFFQTQGDTVLIDVLHDDRGAFQCGLISNTTTHNTGTENSGQFYIRRFFFPRTGFLLQCLIIQEQTNQTGRNVSFGHLGKAFGFHLDCLVTGHASMLLHGLDGFHRRWIVLASLACNKCLGDLERHHAFHGVKLDLALLLFTTGQIVQLTFVALFDNGNSGINQLVGFNYGVNSTHFQGSVSTVFSTARNPFNGIIHTNQAGQSNGTAEAREDAQLHFRQTYLGLGSHYTVVGRQTHFETTAQSDTVNSRDGREREVFNGVEYRVSLEVVGNEVFLGTGKQLGELGDIGTDDKAVLGTGNNQALQVLLGFECFSCGAQLFDGETVELVD